MILGNRLAGSAVHPKAKELSVNDEERLTVLAEYAIKQAKSVPGDFIEMGVFRGGSAILMADALAREQSPYHLHLLDSWEGLPHPGKEDIGTIADVGRFAEASAQEVEHTLDQLQLSTYCRLHQGEFRDTLLKVHGPFSLAHIDCDFYDAVKECLLHVLPRMAEGGIVIVDDVGTESLRRFPGVWKALTECTFGTDWHIVSLVGQRDQAAVLMR